MRTRATLAIRLVTRVTRVTRVDIPKTLSTTSQKFLRGVPNDAGGNWLPSLPGTYPSLPSFVDRSRDPWTETTVIYPSLRRWIIRIVYRSVLSKREIKSNELKMSNNSTVK